MRGSRGFTLLEMMVALALVSLMSLAIFQAYRFSQRSLLQVTLVDAGSRDVAAAQRFLRQVLEQAYPFEAAAESRDGQVPSGLVGAADSLEVSAPGLAAEGSAGLYRFGIRLEADGNGDLVVRWMQDRNGVSGLDANQQARREVILSGVQSLSVSYLELVERGDGQVEPHWHDAWSGKSSAPALVRIRVKFAADDRRRWPEFVVAPRISTDANCVFDVVSQVCRMAT